MAVLCGSAAASGGQAGRDRPAVITIRETFIKDGGFAIEGFIPFLALERSSDHALVLDSPFPALEQDSARHAVKLQTPPGTYFLYRYMRICDGNCGVLDPPAATCHRQLRLSPGQHLALHIRASISTCTIRQRARRR